MRISRNALRSVWVATALFSFSSCAEQPDDAPVVEPEEGVLEDTIPPEEMKVVDSLDEIDRKADCIFPRSDVVDSVTLESGLWGGWAACPSFCPAGSWATDISIIAEPSQGGGDDTAMNALAFRCRAKDGTYRAGISSLTGNWGVQSSWLRNGTFDPLVSMNRRFESSQGGGDDTTMNGVYAWTKGGTLLYPTVANQTSYGTWRATYTFCPANTAICGLATRVEGSQGGGDDTALNGVYLMCCNL